MVFTANAAMIYRKIAVMARFRHPQRQGEVMFDEDWLRTDGFEIRHVPEDIALRRRRRRAVLRRNAIRRLSHSQPRPRASANRRNARLPRDPRRTGRSVLLPPRHLLLPARAGQAIYFPPAFDDYGRAALKAHVA